MDAAEVAKSLVGPTGAYHTHEEQLSHLSAAAYIWAAAAFAFSKPTHIHGSVALLVILTAIGGLLYVSWQLERRDEAARAVAVIRLTRPKRSHDAWVVEMLLEEVQRAFSYVRA